MRLSNSAISTFEQCSFKYKLHYIKKLRPTYTSSALHFGKCVDSALNALLLTKKENLTKEESELISKYTAEELFDEEFATLEINNTKYPTLDSDRISWTKTDFDISLLQQEDYDILAKLEDFDITRDSIYTIEKDCLAMLKEFKKVTGDLRKVHHTICYLSMRRKAKLLIDAYRLEVMPEIEVVHGIQIPIELPNDAGDMIIGFIDFDATFKDGVRRVMDNKTASKAYTEKMLEESQQLCLYSEFMDNRQVGYAVLVKALRKKAPFVRTQLLFGTISEELVEKTFDTVGKVEYSVKSEEFKKDFDKCFSFGQKCPYFAFCRDSNNLNNLENLKEKK